MAFISLYFNDMVGDTSKVNGPISHEYWPSHIYEEFTFQGNEARCAKMCLVETSKVCNFYYFISGDPNTCYLGDFNRDDYKSTHPSDITADTVYKLRSDLGKKYFSLY